MEPKTNETPTMENPSNDNENTTPKRKRGKRKSKNDDVVTASKDVSKSQENQIIHEEIQRVWNAINNLNTMLSELTSSGKELPDQNETISATPCNSPGESATRWVLAEPDDFLPNAVSFHSNPVDLQKFTLTRWNFL